jgi:hypothetical protein
LGPVLAKSQPLGANAVGVADAGDSIGFAGAFSGTDSNAALTDVFRPEAVIDSGTVIDNALLRNSGIDYGNGPVNLAWGAGQWHFPPAPASFSSRSARMS